MSSRATQKAVLRLLTCAHDNDVIASRPIFVAGNSTDGPPGHRDWHTVGDALPLYDSTTRDVHLLFTRDNHDVFYSRSSDNGLSWDTPANISSSARVGNGADFCGTGHQGGLQLPDDSATLLVPMYGCGTGKPFILASADHGKTWGHRGAIDAPANEWTLAPTDRLVTRTRQPPT